MTDLWQRVRRIGPESFEWHEGRRYTRYVARAVSVLAFTVIVSLVGWLAFASVSCWGGRPSLFDIYMCRLAPVAPIAAAFFLCAAVGALISGLRWYPESEGRQLDERGDYYPHLKEVRAELAERDRHRRTVAFAFELTIWATASLIAMWLFYSPEYSFPLGLLAIAGAVRVAVAVIRRSFRDSMPTPPPQQPTSG